MSRNRRNKLFWEPIYEPGFSAVFPDQEWIFDNHTGFKDVTFRPEGQRETALVVDGVEFNRVDFEGDFSYRIIFKNCKFTRVDFGLSSFSRAKFTKCSFESTSFGHCKLIDCELRDCKFSEISISGNETILEKTLITNPSEFISNARTNLKHLPEGYTRFQQKKRLEITKSTVARLLMVALTEEGSEDTYYDGVKTSTLQDCRARIAHSSLRIRDGWVASDNRRGFLSRAKDVLLGAVGVVGGFTDKLILGLIGASNSWGSSVVRPVMLGLIAILVFGAAFSYVESLSFGLAIEKSTELFLLFGYTKHSSLGQVDDIQAIQLANAIVGLVWYVVTIPTIVNKLTRVRG